MPWRDRIAVLTPPLYCRPLSDAWLVSATLSIVDPARPPLTSLERGAPASAQAPVAVRPAQQSTSQRHPTAAVRAATASARDVTAAGMRNDCSMALQEKLGWTTDVKTLTVTSQLLRLGVMHREVCGAWMCILVRV